MSTDPSSSGREERGDRRPYETPTLTAIDLKAEEVLGTACKLSTGGGLPTLCATGNCLLTGS